MYLLKKLAKFMHEYVCMHTYSSGVDLGFAEGIGVNLNIVSLKQGVWGAQPSRS